MTIYCTSIDPNCDHSCWCCHFTQEEYDQWEPVRELMKEEVNRIINDL